MTPVEIDDLVSRFKERRQESLRQLMQLLAQRGDPRPRARCYAHQAQERLELQRGALRQAKSDGQSDAVRQAVLTLEATWRANAAAAHRLQQVEQLPREQLARVDAAAMVEEIEAYPHVRAFQASEHYLDIYLATTIVNTGRYRFEIGDFWVRYSAVVNRVKVFCLRSTSDSPNFLHPCWYTSGHVCLGKSISEICDYLYQGQPHPALDIIWKILTDPAYELSTLRHWRKIS